MNDFHDDPTVESATGNLNTGAPIVHPPYAAPVDANPGYAPLLPQRPPRAPRRLGRWLVAGGLVAALGIGVVGGGALALAHANANSSAPNGAVGATTLAQGKGHHGPGRFGSRGPLTVTAVNGQTITATRPDGAKVTIHTSSSTIYTRAGQKVSASAVKTGEHIRIRGTRNADGSITATRIDIALPGFAGVVTVVNGNTITIQTRSGTHTIDVTASTRYIQGRGPTAQSVSLSAIKVGDRIAAEGTLNNNGSLSALVVHIGLARPASPPNGSAPSAVPGGSVPPAPAGL